MRARSDRIGSLIAQRFHRIDARGAPGRVDRHDDSDAEGPQADEDHFLPVELGRQAGQEIDRRVEDLGPRGPLDEILEKVTAARAAS